jgi:RimJ/RimL family protein N-acetyltransferase
MLFDLPLGGLSDFPQDLGLAYITHVDRYTLGSAATKLVEQAVLTESNSAYREDLRSDGQLYAIDNGQGEVACYGFVIYESFYKRILDEANTVPMISNCFTFPPHRGQGFYPRMLQAICRSLASQGQRRVIITCATDNFASIRGIEKAGFRRVKTLYTLVLFARWIAWQKCVKESGRGT